MKNSFLPALLGVLLAPIGVLALQNGSVFSAPADVNPGSINCEDVAYPYPTSSLPLTLYGQELRISYMDVPPLDQPNGHTVVLLHGNNFAGFYFGGPIDAIRKEGFRVVVPDQIGYGRSSKPIMPYNFSDMARNTRLVLQSLKIDKVIVIGHSMGGMLAARFATQYPAMVERLVLYNPIGLVDVRFDRPLESADDAY
jgi:pimeloyl-ACP methyl ester carboxylesterase